MTEPTAGGRRRAVRGISLAVVVLLVIGELAAGPVAAWRTRRALADCEVESVQVDLGARPHLTALVTAHLTDVSAVIEGARLGPVRVARVEAELARVEFARRQALGLGGPLRLDGGTIRAQLTEQDLDGLFPVPLAQVRVNAGGVFLEALGSRVEILVTVDDGRLRLGLFDDSLPSIGIPLPAGVGVTSVTPASGILHVEATLERLEIDGAIPC